MPLYALDHRLWFPDTEDALEDGLLAIGGDLSAERLLLAYKRGIFPWFEGNIPLWWCPDPRFVLFPEKLTISKSMKTIIRKNTFRFTINNAFEAVIYSCKKINRHGQDGTWITDEVEQAYLQLHKLGYAHSAEAWIDDKLAGGLYGIWIGKFFFGESMFSNKSNASKFAFIQYVQFLRNQGIVLIDCQVYTPHLETLGATMIPRKAFTALLKEHIS